MGGWLHLYTTTNTPPQSGCLTLRAKGEAAAFVMVQRWASPREE